LTFLVTTWSYLPNSGDRRLASIGNVGLSTGQYSNYGYTTTPENLISAITESSDAATVYPTAATQTATYNNLNQLTNLSGQALTFDANGNLTTDGLRNYSWNAENRLVGITYPGQPGKATAFSYDGVGRRTAIASTPTGGGSTVTTSYLWCGASICQARGASNSVTREYFGEGEFLPGSPSQAYYYGPDQIGSVRRVFASTTSAPAFAYDPYGNALQSTVPLTDFNYAGMFYNADSSLYLTQYRLYDPIGGRWLSRDPIGETVHQSDSTIPYLATESLGMTVSNRTSTQSVFGLPFGRKAEINSFATGNDLYVYVNGDPIYNYDHSGLCPIEQVNWVRKCIVACALAAGLADAVTRTTPNIDDAAPDPAPIILPAPPSTRPSFIRPR
jgi:RHS repeat-associated protein